MRTLVRGAVILAMLCVAGPSYAALLTLEAVAPDSPLQQQTNNPCVLGGNDCNSRKTAEINDFTQTPTGNSGVNISWDLESPGYLVGAVRFLFGDNFFVGLDFSQAQGQDDQVLGLFAMTVNGNVVDLFVGPQAVPPTPGGNAGNGFADYVLKGFDISSFAATDIIKFHAIMPVSNDGPDQAFLIRNQDEPPVPEPTSMALLALGFFGVAFKVRRRH